MASAYRLLQGNVRAAQVQLENRASGDFGAAWLNAGGAVTSGEIERAECLKGARVGALVVGPHVDVVDAGRKAGGGARRGSHEHRRERVVPVRPGRDW